MSGLLQGGMAERQVSKHRCGVRPRWSLMPHEIICLIFRYLSDKDRYRARIVCKKWNAVFHSPQLWRARSFFFFGDDAEEGARGIRYLQRFGSQLRHMDLKMRLPGAQNAKTLSLYVETLLNATPPDVNLKVFTLAGLEYYQTPLTRISRNRARVVRALCAFLSRQKGLERVDMSSCHMGWEEGSAVLRALTGGLSRDDKPETGCLRYLDLSEFFKNGANVLEIPAFLDEMEKFAGLRQVCLNFIYLNDTMLNVLTKRSPGLSILAVAMNGSQLILISHMADNKQLVTPAGWRVACANCPQMLVAVSVRGRFRLIDFQPLLLPEVPLVTFTIISRLPSPFFGWDDMMDHFGFMMRYLAVFYTRTFSGFHLGWYRQNTQIRWTEEDALVSLVRKCPCLRYVSLASTVPVRTVLKVAKAAKAWGSTGCPELDPLYIYVTGFERKIKSAALRAKLSKLGSNCVVIVDGKDCPGKNCPC